MIMLTGDYFDIESSCMHSTNSDPIFIITEEFNMIQIQRRLLSSLNKILKYDPEVFKLTKAGDYNRTGYFLNEAISELFMLEKNISEHQQLHPTIQLFSSVLKFHGLTELSIAETTVINRALLLFRENTQSVSHKRQLRNFQRAASKNLKGTLTYIDHLFEHHSRLLVVRVDLSYQKESIRDKTISTHIARAHRKSLFKRIHVHSLFKHCLGYIWKLEYGQYKGLHYHTCFFFDGSKVRGDIMLARRIGEFWRNEITGGQGLYFNCNAIANTYAQSGIGDIHYTNHEKRRALQRIITYITKVDTAVRMVLPQGARSFGRGECILQTGQKRGRPRNSID